MLTKPAGSAATGVIELAPAHISWERIREGPPCVRGVVPPLVRMEPLLLS